MDSARLLAGSLLERHRGPSPAPSNVMTIAPVAVVLP
jgi:hypothetical protein